MKRLYGTLSLTPDKKWLLKDIPPHVAIVLKQVFHRIAKTQVKEFHFPCDEFHGKKLEWFSQMYPFDMSPSDAAVLKKFKKAYERNQSIMEDILLPDFKADPYTGLQPGMSLRPYQSQIIELVLRRKGLLCGDDLGLGKTYTGLGLLLNPECRPAAVVVEPHLQKQWAVKLQEFTTLKYHLIKGTRPYDLPEADVYIFKYTQLSGWSDIFAQGFFKTAIYDEIQQLRTGVESQKGSGAYVLSSNVKYRLGLSATPIFNYGAEIWNIFQYLDDSLLGTRHEFEREWTDGFGKVSQPEALGTALREQHAFVRRTKKDVGQHMPKVNRMIEEIEADEGAIRSIYEVARALALKITTGSFFERGQAARELDLLARQATGVGKARAAAAYAKIFLDTNIPILLVGWHRDVYDIWLKELADYRPVMYTGSESTTEKERSKKAFINGETNLMILSLRSGAGVDDLQTRCSTVIFGEVDWSPKVHDQVIGRLDREGQTEPVTAIFLSSNDGSDPPMIDLLGIKSAQSSAIIDPDKIFETNDADDSRVKALVRQFLEKCHGTTPPATADQGVLFAA